MEVHLRFTLILLVAVGVGSYAPARAAQKDSAANGYAKPVTDDYFGKKIIDPYRWMEAGVSDPHFVVFLKKQNQATKTVLAKLAVPRAKLLARIEAFDSATTMTRDWVRAGTSFFYRETAPHASDAVLRVRDSGGMVRTLLDPKDYKSSAKHAAIDYFVPSNDGLYVAVGVSLGGSEDSTLSIIDVANGKTLPDAISRTQYGAPSWRSDQKSFFYFRQQKLTRDAPPTATYENGRTFLHVLGTDPEQDVAIFGPGLPGSPNIPKAGFSSITASPDSAYVVATYSAGTTDNGSVYVASERDATRSDTPWKQILSPEDKLSTGDSPIVLLGGKLYILSNKESPNGGILVFDLERLENQPKTVVAPSEAVLDAIYGANDALYISGRKGIAKTLARLQYSDIATSEQITLPVQGSTFSIDASPMQPGILFGLQSWIVPPLAYRYNPKTNNLSDTELQPKNPIDFSKLEVREVQAASTDGATVPISIILRRDINLDGSHLTLFEGYGAYGISCDPDFNPRYLPAIFAWIERGGVFAVAHVRGGGEYGERWHLAAQKATKQHTVDDMIATARYLIENKYTSPDRLAVRGTSAGGIAVGNSIVQHPELFAAAIDNVGVTNMLRFQITQGGAANIPEFGDVKKPEEFEWLYAISAYHHISDGIRYPAVLGVTGINDPRVPSWMIAEFVARLQRATSSGKPVLLRVDFDAGHGLGSNRTQLEQAAADQLSFLLWQMGDREFNTSTLKHNAEAH